MHYLGTQIVVRAHPCCKRFFSVDPQFFSLLNNEFHEQTNLINLRSCFYPLITKFPIPNLGKDNIQTFFLAKILNYSLVYFQRTVYITIFPFKSFAPLKTADQANKSLHSLTFLAREHLLTFEQYYPLPTWFGM